MLTLLHLPHLISLLAALLVLFHVLLFALWLYIWIRMDLRATTRGASSRKSPAGPAGDRSEADTLEPRADTLAPRAASHLRRATSTAPKRVSSAVPAPDGLDAGLPAPWAAPPVGRAHSTVILSISSRVVGSTPANSSPSPRALQGLSAAPASVMRTRGGGEAEKGGVPQHQSILNRRLLSSPAPSPPPGRGAWGSANDQPPPLPHTLGRHGYMGTEEECREAASRPLVDHDGASPSHSRALAILPAAPVPDTSLLQDLRQSWLRSAEARACFDSFAEAECPWSLINLVMMASRLPHD